MSNVRGDVATKEQSPRAAVGRRPRYRKEGIRVAARDLFVEKGFPNVTMAQIAARVGITAPALYRHFPNKAELLREVIDDSFGWLFAHQGLSSDYPLAVDEAMHLLRDRPSVVDLWIHEIRYLESAELDKVRSRMLEWAYSFSIPLSKQLPNLDAGQRDLLIWGIQSLLAGLNRRAMRCPDDERRSAVRDGLHALLAAPLTPTRPSVPVVGQPLEPLSVRERLLSAAVEQLSERDYHETTMSNIAIATNMSTASVYGYFPSKAELMRAVMERGTHSLWLSLHAAFAERSSAKEILAEAIRSYSLLVGPWASSLERPTGEQDLDDASRSVQHEYVAEWVRLLELCRPDLGATSAHSRVQLGFFLIADLFSIRRLAATASFIENVTSIVLTVLLFDGGDGSGVGIDVRPSPDA